MGTPQGWDGNGSNNSYQDAVGYRLKDGYPTQFGSRRVILSQVRESVILAGLRLKSFPSD